jgi:hypothetical protein
MSAFVKIDQTTLSAGVAGVSRTDGLAGGQLVTLTDVGLSNSTRFRVLWTPVGDTTAVSSLTQTGPKTWTFSPTAARYGTYLVELIGDEGLPTEYRERRVLVVRTPTLGLIIPALNERADPAASLANAGAAQIEAADNNANDFTSNAVLNTLRYAGWLRALHEIIMQLDSGAGGSPIDPQRALGNNGSTPAIAAPVTVHQMLDWVGAGALWFWDGVNDFASAGNNLSHERTDTVTHIIWFRTNKNQGFQDLFSKEVITTSRGYAAFIDSSGQIFFNLVNDLPGVNLISVRTGPGFNDGAEHMVKITYDGSSGAAGVQISVDGAVQALTVVNNTLAATTLSAGNLVLGAAFGGSLQFFEGVIRHYSQWNVVLAPALDALLYNGGVPPDLLALPQAPNLIGWWKLDELDVTGAGGINDYSTGNHDMTANGGLNKAAPVGSLLVRGVNGVWQQILPVIADIPLVANGVGKVPTYRPLGVVYDPFEVEYFDDFTSGGETTAGVASGTIGSMGWSGNFSGAAGSITRLDAAQQAQGPGIIRVVGGGANGNTQALFLGTVSDRDVVDMRAVKFWEWLVWLQWTAGNTQEVRMGIGTDPLAASSGTDGVLFTMSPATFPNTIIFIARQGGVNEAVDTLVPCNNATPLAFRFRLGFNPLTSLYEWTVQRSGSPAVSGTQPGTRVPNAMGNPYLLSITSAAGVKNADLDYQRWRLHTRTRGL